MYVDTEACLVGIQVSGKISYSTGLLRVKYGGMGGKEREGERRSHSSRSIGVPEVIGNDKVGKMRERGKDGRKKWNGEAAIGMKVWKTMLPKKNRHN